MADGAYRPLDRRPIASRDLEISRRAAAWLASRGVSPNAISLAGMGAGLAAGLALWSTAPLSPPWERCAWIAAAAGVQIRLVANMLDGMVAVQTGRASPLGELYNELPDRVSDAAALIGLGHATGGHALLGYAAACVAVLTAYVRAVGKAAGAPQEFCGPMAKQQRMFLVTIAAVYCGLAPSSWQPAWGEPPAAGIPAAVLLMVVIGGLWTAGRRVRRIARNLRSRGC